MNVERTNTSELRQHVRNASVVALRALLASRFRQQEHAIFASADLNNNDFISAQALGSTRLPLRDGIEIEQFQRGVRRTLPG